MKLLVGEKNGWKVYRTIGDNQTTITMMIEKIKTKFLNWKHLRQYKRNEITRLTSERLLGNILLKKHEDENFDLKPTKENMEKYIDMIEKKHPKTHLFTD